MELTYAKTQEDLEQIADFMAKVFARRSYFDFYKRRIDYQTLDPHFKPEHSRIIKEAGRIVSHVSIVEKYMRIGQSLVKIAGIGDVFTLPEARGKSYSRILMEDAVRYMKEHDYHLSMLYGIPDYYHKFGYIEAMAQYSTFIPLAHLSDLEVKHPLRPAQEKDRSRLNTLYNRAYGAKTGSMQRLEAHWYKMLDPRRVLVATDEADEATGYVIATPARDPEPHVHEMVAEDVSLARSFLAHYRNLVAERLESELQLRMAPDHPVIQLAQTIGGRFTTRLFHEGEGQAMLRAIDLARTLEAIREELQSRLDRSSFQGSSGGLNFVTDDVGEAALSVCEGKIQVSPRSDSKRPTVEIAQNLLTRLLIGYASLEQIQLREPAVQVDPDSARLLEALFPPQHPLSCEADYF